MKKTQNFDALQWTILDTVDEGKLTTNMKLSVVSKNDKGCRAWGWSFDVPAKFLCDLAVGCERSISYEVNMRQFRKKLGQRVDRIASNSEHKPDYIEIAPNVIAVRYDHRVVVIDTKTGFNQSFAMNKNIPVQKEDLLAKFKAAKKDFDSAQEGRYNGVAKIEAGYVNEVLASILFGIEEYRFASPEMHNFMLNRAKQYTK